RSTAPILALANDLIARNKHRHGKVLRAEKKATNAEKPEVFVYENEDLEGEAIIREIRDLHQAGRKYEEMAVLYRSNSQSSLLETLLRQNQIPYSVSGGTSMFDRKEIKDVVAFLRFSVSRTDLSLRRILNLPPRGIGDQSFALIEKFAQAHGNSFLWAAERAAQAGLPAATSSAVADFLTMMKPLGQRIVSAQSGPALALTQFLDELGYRKYLFDTTSEASSAEKKWNLVEIFARILEQFLSKNETSRNEKSESSLEEFLDRMELRDQLDNDRKSDEVSLMTLHASKGLEFPVVFLIGVEEDLLPHRTLGSNVDEERRLFYVGLTRAQEKLILSYCKSRRRYGANRPVAVSRFLHEIRSDLVTTFPDGVRPWKSNEREQKLADFFAAMEAKKSAAKAPAAKA
ncbi:MAG: ATP-dependent DNA helicase, partial [Bdellovibrio sp.]